MANPPPLKIRRNQLEAFLKDDFEAIRQFELLFKSVEDLIVSGAGADRKTVFYAKNDSGGAVSIGQAVMFSGSVGASGTLKFTKAVSDGSVPHEYLMGITGQDFAKNEFGEVYFFGTVRGFRTDGGAKTVPETWNDGDLLYMDPAYPGELTNVQPAAPNLHAPIAAVIYATSGNSGSIFVRALPGESLSELHDVYIPSPSDGQVLTYVSSNSRWEAATPAAGGGTDSIVHALILG